MNWSAPVSNSEAYASAGGRRRYNAERQVTRDVRAAEAMRRVFSKDFGHASYAAVAREMGVHRSTVGRWLKSFRASAMTSQCPTCLREIPKGEWAGIAARKGRDYIENPFSLGGQLRMAAIGAICDELPRVLADLGVFVDDEDDDGQELPKGRRVVLADIVRGIVERIDAA